MTYLFRPIHPTLHKNADGSNFQCLQTESNSFWLKHSFKLDSPVYVLVQFSQQDLEWGIDNDYYNELAEFRCSYIPKHYYNEHLSSWDVNNFLNALANGLDGNYGMNFWQQEVYKLWLQDKGKRERQEKDFEDVAQILTQDLHFDFSDPELVNVY